MSLNPCEQRVHDYWEGHQGERQFWEDKVRLLAARAGNLRAAAAKLEAELWTYYVERSASVAPFREATRREGLPRTSMMNLAELLLRRWTDLRPPRPGQNQNQVVDRE